LIPPADIVNRPVFGGYGKTNVSIANEDISILPAVSGQAECLRLYADAETESEDE
jgi:hypothetical protein